MLFAKSLLCDLGSAFRPVLYLRGVVSLLKYNHIYRNLVIFRVENNSYVIILYSLNFVRSPYRIRNTCENFVVEKYSYV